MDPTMIVDWLGTTSTHLGEVVLAQSEFEVDPVAPPGMDGPIKSLLGYAKWLAYAVTVLGIMIAGAAAVISRQQGSSEEGTQTAIRIGIGAAVIGAAGSILSMFTSA